MERQNFCQKLYGIKQKAFRATFVNRWSSSSSQQYSSSISGILVSSTGGAVGHSALNIQIMEKTKLIVGVL